MPRGHGARSRPLSHCVTVSPRASSFCFLRGRHLRVHGDHARLRVNGHTQLSAADPSHAVGVLTRLPRTYPVSPPPTARPTTGQSVFARPWPRPPSHGSKTLVLVEGTRQLRAPLLKVGAAQGQSPSRSPAAGSL